MLNSNYYTVQQQLKKKLLEEKAKEGVPSTEELDAEIAMNKPALTKKQVDASEAGKDRTDASLYGGPYDIKAYTGNNFKKDSNNIEDDMDEASDAAGSVLKDSGKGAAVLTGITGAADMAMTVASQKGPMNKDERKANTMNLAMKGASAGAAVGSVIPGVGTLIGGLAGGVIGGATGIIQGLGDQKQLDQQAKMQRIADIEKTRSDREKAQKLEDEKSYFGKKKNILDSQKGVLGAKYLPIKNS